VLGCGCNLTIDSEASIRNAGFEIDYLRHLITEDMPGFDPAIYPLILGTTTRSGVTE